MRNENKQTSLFDACPEMADSHENNKLRKSLNINPLPLGFRSFGKDLPQSIHYVEVFRIHRLLDRAAKVRSRQAFL